MKIVFAADGSEYTSRALAFLVAHPSLSEHVEVLVLNVQPALPSRVTPWVGADVLKEYHHDEAHKVIDPITLFLDRHPIRFRCEWVVGSPADKIVEAARRERADLIVMGTHGYGLVGRVVMGSVAQRVIAECDVPLLLVK